VVNFNEIGCKQCNKNNHMDSIFVTFKHTVHEFHEKLFPRVNNEIQIRDFCSRKTWKI